MRRLLTIIAIIGGLAPASAQAVTLVNPDGTPVGGKWQQWVDEMKIPTIAGSLTFVVSSDPCLGAPGCSMGPFPGGSSQTDTWIDNTANDSLAQYTLYFELGHQFDWGYLTPWQRTYLLHRWKIFHTDWWKPLDGDFVGGALFSADYANCAVGESDKGGTFGLWAGGPNANPTTNTCKYITHLGLRYGADMEQSQQRWTK